MSDDHRKPPPPETLVDALQDRIVPASGPLLASTPIDFPALAAEGKALRAEIEQRMRPMTNWSEAPDEQERRERATADGYLMGVQAGDRQGHARGLADAAEAIAAWFKTQRGYEWMGGLIAEGDWREFLK